jgi:hypothetical protein
LRNFDRVARRFDVGQELVRGDARIRVLPEFFAQLRLLAGWQEVDAQVRCPDGIRLVDRLRAPRIEALQRAGERERDHQPEEREHRRLERCHARQAFFPVAPQRLQAEAAPEPQREQDENEKRHADRAAENDRVDDRQHGREYARIQP